MISDLHVHSIWSSDCLVPAEEQIEKALSLGMKHICITDHNDYDAPVFPPDYFNFLIDDKGDEDSLNRYASALHSLKEKYAGRIEVLAGIELGMQPHLAEKLTKLVEEYSFDMVIGSTHSFEGMDAEDPRHYKDIPVEKAIGNYFEEELKNLTLFSGYDTVGHMDFALRYAPGAAEKFSYAAYAEVLDAILGHIIRNDKALEINTSKYVLKNMTNPNFAIVRRYAELGGRLVTFGSDSHVSSRIGEGFTDVAEMLKAAGIKEFAVFRNHIPETFPIN